MRSRRRSSRGTCTRRGRVADASCHLFEAVTLVQFAVAWLEAGFGEPEGGSPTSASRSAPEGDRQIAHDVEGRVGSHGGEEALPSLEHQRQADAHRGERGNDEEEGDSAQMHYPEEDSGQDRRRPDREPPPEALIEEASEEQLLAKRSGHDDDRRQEG